MPEEYGDPHRFLLEQLGRHSTLADLRRSDFFSRHSSGINSLLETVEIIRYPHAVPRIAGFLRVAQWNLEKGKRLREAVRLIEADELLKLADVILVNEVDRGMNRSGNRHIAYALGSELGMNVAYAPACLELTKGIDEELELPGENCESMQGNAVLSRYPIGKACVVRLPQCFEPYEFHEKRYGGRNCLWVQLQIGEGILWVGSTHLEVRNTPACRARQMQKIVEDLPGGPREPLLLAGDLNTNRMPRGTRLRTLSAVLRMVLADPEAMKGKFLRPQPFEPLFAIAARAGLSPEGLNSTEATATSTLDDSEDAAMVPGPIRKLVQRRLSAYRGVLEMKLDWFLSRGVAPLRGGEITDHASGAVSCDPRCIPTTRTGPDRISDHSPICADLRIIQA